MIVIDLAGPPMAKGRPRFTKEGRAYTPERTATFEAKLTYAAQVAMNGRPPLDGPLRVSVDVYMPIPESKPKRWKLLALAQRLWPTKKPDADNFAKVLDAMNMIVWVDDSQIVDLHVRKFYSDRPRFEAWVSEMADNSNRQDIFA